MDKLQRKIIAKLKKETPPFEEWIEKMIKQEKNQTEPNERFLEQVLIPLAENNRAKRLRKKRLIKRISLVASSLVMIVAIIGLALYFNQPKEIDYLSNYDMRPVDIANVNNALTDTHIGGEFSDVTLYYHADSGRSLYFTLVQEIINDNSLIDCSVEIIIEKNLRFDFENQEYDINTEYLGYSLKYKVSKEQTYFEEIPLNEFTVQAYLTTGNERYYIQYHEITVETKSGFNGYLQTLIHKK